MSKDRFEVSPVEISPIKHGNNGTTSSYAIKETGDKIAEIYQSVSERSGEIIAAHTLAVEYPAKKEQSFGREVLFLVAKFSDES